MHSCAAGCRSMGRSTVVSLAAGSGDIPEWHACRTVMLLSTCGRKAAAALFAFLGGGGCGLDSGNGVVLPDGTPRLHGMKRQRRAAIWCWWFRFPLA